MHHFFNTQNGQLSADQQFFASITQVNYSLCVATVFWIDGWNAFAWERFGPVRALSHVILYPELYLCKHHIFILYMYLFSSICLLYLLYKKNMVTVLKCQRYISSVRKSEDGSANLALCHEKFSYPRPNIAYISRQWPWILHVYIFTSFIWQI